MPEQVERELLLEASRAEVWKAITGPGWLADEVSLELWPGGEARFSDSNEVRVGWVENAVAPATLIFWWAPEGEPDEPASRVELTLQERGDGATRLRVVETRPLQVLDLVGIPLSGAAGARYGPALLAA